MKFDLKGVRESYGLSVEEFAAYCGIMPCYYINYENGGEVPCKYIYLLWKNLPDFPLPDDFFYYTSLTLRFNMVYHNMTQIEIAKRFDTMQQTISHYITRGPILMYEMKDKFLSCFNPIIVPYTVENKNGELTDGRLYTDYKATGNFMASERKKQYKYARRDAAEIALKEQRKIETL